MTENDVSSTPLPGQWVLVDPQHSTAVLANPQLVPQAIPQYTPPPPMKAAEVLPTSGIVLDQKVFVALILLLGAIAGIILMLILDKYAKPAPREYHAEDR